METKTLKSNLRPIAFALAALTATIPASAIAGAEARSETVSYGDLNLATPAGIEALDRRLDRAVERVCGSNSSRTLQVRRDIERCEADAWQSIQDDREFAIAKATGRHAQLRADNTRRQPTQVSLAE